jgi:hypothetical protein
MGNHHFHYIHRQRGEDRRLTVVATDQLPHCGSELDWEQVMLFS